MHDPIDIPDELAEIIALHREMFSGWVMEDTDEDDQDEPQDEPVGDEEPDDDPADDDPDGADALGDAGKKALDAMKARVKAEQAKRRAAEKAASDARDALAKAQGEDEAAAQRRQVEATALARANQRIVKAEIRTAAKGVLADPNDALVYLDLDDIEVGDDGDVDTDDIADRIADLVAKKPYLAAQRGSGGGGFDSGRGKPAKKAQLTREQFAALPHADRLKAVEDGRFKVS